MILAIIMVILAGIYRLQPHPLNIAPIAALAFVGGMYLGRRFALWVPFVILAITDVILNIRMDYPIFYWPRIIDYFTFLSIGLLGMWLRGRQTSAKVAGGIATPFLFFAASNFGVWLFGLNLAGETYPKTIGGLIECYMAGLPFLRGTMLGDWLFMGLFVGAACFASKPANTRFQWLIAEAKA